MGPCQVVGVVRCGFNVIAVVIMQCMLIHIEDRNVPHHIISLFIATQKATFFLFNVIHQLSSYNHRESRSNAIALQHLLVSNQKNH